MFSLFKYVHFDSCHPGTELRSRKQVSLPVTLDVFSPLRVPCLLPEALPPVSLTRTLEIWCKSQCQDGPSRRQDPILLSVRIHKKSIFPDTECLYQLGVSVQVFFFAGSSKFAVEMLFCRDS